MRTRTLSVSGNSSNVVNVFCLNLLLASVGNETENQCSEIVAVPSAMVSQSPCVKQGIRSNQEHPTRQISGQFGYQPSPVAPSGYQLPNMQAPQPQSSQVPHLAGHGVTSHSNLHFSSSNHISGSNLSNLDNILQQSPRATLRTGVPVRYAEPLFWCQIRYYELTQQVGEVCYVSPAQFAVDGGTDPSSADRFCLGSLSNVNRWDGVEATRNNIGKGLQLYRTRDYEIHVKCLGDHPLFVQSQCCNLRYNWDPGTVCKIPPDYNLKVFTMGEFHTHLSQQLNRNSSYKSIMELTSLCSIRISFIKGQFNV